VRLHPQDIIVFVVVAFAAYYLIRRLAFSAQGHSGGACSKCTCEDKKAD
jgi:hypothetical protein